jgi:hypothetical protein
VKKAWSYTWSTFFCWVAKIPFSRAASSGSFILGTMSVNLIGLNRLSTRFLEKSFIWFSKFLSSPAAQALGREQRSVILYEYDMVSKISTKASMGKDGKFQVFLLLSLRFVQQLDL